MMAAARRVLRGIAFDMDGTLTGQISITYDFIGMAACIRLSNDVRSEIQRSIRDTAGVTTTALVPMHASSKQMWSRSPSFPSLLRCEPPCLQIQKFSDATTWSKWLGVAVPCIDFQLMRERAGVLEGDILEVIAAMEPAARKSALDAIWDVEQQVRIVAICMHRYAW